jgi:capsid protein
MVRNRLVRNSRYEVANNCYAKGIVLTLANDIIGTGPRLHMRTDDQQLNRLIEQKFELWSRSIGLAGKLRTMQMAKVTDGEAFAMLHTNRALRGVQLDIRLLESDQVDSPGLMQIDPRYPEGVQFAEGQRFDLDGNVTHYCVYRSHPGGLSPSYEFDEVEARYMIHWYRKDRPGQLRGIPEMTAALPLFAHLRRYTLAVVQAAELAAEWTLFLKTTAPAGGEAEGIADGAFSEIDIERGLMTSLPEGWEPFQLAATQPTTTYEMGKREFLNEIGRCLNLPYNIVACNSSGYNYASGRLDHQTYYKSRRVDRVECNNVVLDRIFGAWLEEAQTEYGFSDPDYDHQWFWEGDEHVDPVKEAEAQAQRLASNTTTLASEYARQGKDWEAELRQRAREVALTKDLGLNPTPVSFGIDKLPKKGQDGQGVEDGAQPPGKGKQPATSSKTSTSQDQDDEGDEP